MGISPKYQNTKNHIKTAAATKKMIINKFHNSKELHHQNTVFIQLPS